MAPGQSVLFVDGDGFEHNALVIHVWETSLNIVYVNPEKKGDDSFGNARIVETSVPFYEQGMSGFYIKREKPAPPVTAFEPTEPDNSGIEEVIENETEIEDLEDNDQGKDPADDEAQGVEDPELTASTGLIHTVDGDGDKEEDPDAKE